MIEKSPKLPWYKGPSILEVLDGFEKAKDLEEKPFRMPVQGIYKFTEEGDDRRIVAGKVESGKISVGDKVVFLPSNKRSEIKSIEIFNVPPQKTVGTGSSVGFTLKEQIYVQRGDVMCRVDDPQPLVGPLIQAEIFWMGKKPMVFNKEYKLKIGTAKVPVHLKKIKKIIDASDLKRAEKEIIERNDVAQCVLECAWSMAFDTADIVEATGRFVIVDEYDIAGGGVISALVRDEQADVREQVQHREMKWDFSIVDPKERAVKYGHRAKLILLTGKVGVDKKSIAKEVEKTLFQQGMKTYFLGIGNLLRGLDADIEKHKTARREHVRRLGEVAHILMDAGLIVFATASNLNDEELRLLQEVTDRSSMFIAHVGPDEFLETVADISLSQKDSASKNAEKILKVIQLQNLLSPSPDAAIG